MRNLIKIIFVYLPLVCLSVNLWGCASMNNAQGLFKKSEYEMILDKQKKKQAALAGNQEKLWDKIPEMDEAGYEKWGDYYLKQGNHGKAYMQYYKALKLKPKHSGIRDKIARMYLKKGMAEQAVIEFRNILSYDPDNARAFEGLGRAYLRLDRLEDAEKNFRQAVKFNPEFWQAYNFLGIIHERRHMYDKAIEEYKTAVSLQPKKASLFNNLGMAFYFTGEYEKAVNSYNLALKTGPSNTRILNNLAMALCRLERYDEAVEAFKRAGNKAAAYNNIGYVYMVEGKSGEAVRAFEKAIETNSRFYVKAHENMMNAKPASGAARLGQ